MLLLFQSTVVITNIPRWSRK